VEDVSQIDLRKLYLVDEPAEEKAFRRLKERTPARLGSGRAGPRYKTVTMLRFRADHAAAQDAVFSELPEDFGDKNGLISVKTQCKDKDEYLTRPDKGRRFDEENAALGGCVKVGVEKYGVRAWELTITKGEGGKSWRKVALLTFLRLGMIDNTFCSIRPDKLGEHILWWQGLGTSRKNK
jgi:hypothetical protein